MESLAGILQSECELASLPPFMPVSAALLDLLSREDAVIAEVADLLQLDSELVGELLDSAGSSAFGFQSRIGSLAQAVVLLGRRRLQSLIRSTGLRRSGHDQTVRGFWRHSVAAAFAAVEMAAEEERTLDDMRRCREEADVDLVHAVCRISEALGFAVSGAGEEEFAGAGILPMMRPKEERRAPPDAGLVAEAAREKIRFICN